MASCKQFNEASQDQLGRWARPGVSVLGQGLVEWRAWPLSTAPGDGGSHCATELMPEGLPTPTTHTTHFLLLLPSPL